MTIEHVLQIYVGRLNELVRDGYKDVSSMPPDPDQFVVEFGRKYVKIVKVGKWQRSVHSFVNKQTGDVYKAAGWKAPVLDPRGNLFTGLLDICTRADVYGSYLYKR